MASNGFPLLLNAQTSPLLDREPPQDNYSLQDSGLEGVTAAGRGQGTNQEA